MISGRPRKIFIRVSLTRGSGCSLSSKTWLTLSGNGYSWYIRVCEYMKLGRSPHMSHMMNICLNVPILVRYLLWKITLACPLSSIYKKPKKNVKQLCSMHNLSYSIVKDILSMLQLIRMVRIATWAILGYQKTTELKKWRLPTNKAQKLNPNKHITVTALTTNLTSLQLMLQWRFWNRYRTRREIGYDVFLLMFLKQTSLSQILFATIDVSLAPLKKCYLCSPNEYLNLSLNLNL